jgi:predicted dehydrogenase
MVYRQFTNRMIAGLKVLRDRNTVVRSLSNLRIAKRVIQGLKALPANISGNPIQYYEEFPPASEYAFPTNVRPRLALVGCGWFACQAHIPALKRLEQEGFVELVALCSRSEESLSRASEQWGSRTLKKYKQLDSLLADPGIDLVDLVLPIGATPEAIRKALEAGKHIISEKPCAPSVAKCMDLLSYYGQLSRRPFCAVAENWRFKNTTLIVKQIVKSGRIGRLYLANFQFIACAPPGPSWRGAPDYPGGHLLDSGVHFVALLREVVGEVERVSATVSQRRMHLPPADSVTAVMTFANGAEGSFQLSFAASPQGARPPSLTLMFRGLAAYRPI